MQSIGLIFDDVSIDYLRRSERPRTAMSHDFNMFQFGHYAQQLGAKVYFGSTSDYRKRRPFRKMTSIYPVIDFDPNEWKRVEDLDVLLSCHIQVFAAAGGLRAKKIAIHPALYFVEMPYLYNCHQTREQLIAARHHVDFILVQNERMKELLISIYGWLADWRDGSRILVAPMGLVEGEERHTVDRSKARAEMGLADRQSLIVNGGGIWRWTGFNDFLRGYIKAVRAGASNVCLALTGFRQTENLDHADYIEETKAILAENSDLVGDRFGKRSKGVSIHVETDWKAASAKLPTFFAAADFGLNVNGKGLENWQSQRVRCLDYIRYGIPLLTTGGDHFSEVVARDAALKLASLEAAEVQRVIGRISDNPATAARLREQAVLVRSRLEQSPGMRAGVEAVLNGDIRSKRSERGSLLDGVWATELPRRREASMQRIAHMLGLS